MISISARIVLQNGTHKKDLNKIGLLKFHSYNIFSNMYTTVLFQMMYIDMQNQ